MPALSSLLCSHCEGAGLQLQPGGQAVCRYCGTANTLEGVVCAHCEHVNAPGAEACLNCRRLLAQACPTCGTRNWAGLETCSACGTSLDTLTGMRSRLGVDTAQRLDEHQRSVRVLKELEMQAGERRLADFNAMEARRQAGLRAAQQRQAAQQRLLLTGAALFALVIVVIVVVSAVLTTLR